MTKPIILTNIGGMATVNVHEAKTHLSRLLERAHAGEEIIIAKGGKPFARLVALAMPEPRRPGLLPGVYDDRFEEPLSDQDLAAWEGRG